MEVPILEEKDKRSESNRRGGGGGGGVVVGIHVTAFRLFIRFVVLVEAGLFPLTGFEFGQCNSLFVSSPLVFLYFRSSFDVTCATMRSRNIEYILLNMENVVDQNKRLDTYE